MARTDLSLAELIEYRPGVAEPSDFDTFWADTLGTTAGIDLAVSLVPVRTRTVSSRSSTSLLPASARVIQAWMTRAQVRDEPQPAVVEFLGYGGRDPPGT